MDAPVEQPNTEIAELRAGRDNWMSTAIAAQATVRELRAENAQLRTRYSELCVKYAHARHGVIED